MVSFQEVTRFIGNENEESGCWFFDIPALTGKAQIWKSLFETETADVFGGKLAKAVKEKKLSIKGFGKFNGRTVLIKCEDGSSFGVELTARVIAYFAKGKESVFGIAEKLKELYNNDCRSFGEKFLEAIGNGDIKELGERRNTVGRHYVCQDGSTFGLCITKYPR